MDVESNSSITPNWFGLGTNECYGKTCLFGEFCSKDMLYQACRHCSDIIAWCDVNRPHLALKYPSCYHICAENDKRDLEAKLNETEEALRVLQKDAPQKDVATEPTLDILHFLLIGLVAFLFLMLVVVCLCSLKKKRTHQKGLQWFPGQTGEHTTLKAPESRVLLPPDAERNEDQQPAHPTTPDHNPPPYIQTQERVHPREASTADKHTRPLAGVGVPTSGFSSMQSTSPMSNGGGGYSVYPISEGRDGHLS